MNYRWMSVALVALFVGSSFAATPTTEPDPDEMLRSIMANGNLRTQGTGEGFAWHAASGAHVFLDAYEAYGNPEWLAAAEKYYTFYIDKLQNDPDGYPGWIGDPIGQNNAKLKTDAVVGDAILSEPLARFAWLVLVKDPDKLKSRFGKTAQGYVDLTTRICWEKWNQRGCYYEDANGYGSYHTYGKLIDPTTNEWVDAPTRVISDNLNKHYSISHVLLKLWQITGKEQYKQRVISVFGRAKSMWRYYPEEDRVVWNFWMPHGPYDLEGRAPKSWVAVHPNRAGYQSGEVSDWVDVYNAGLVFTKQDLQRIIRTNHWMMPGDGRNAWRNADGTTDAGTLWTALARFDPEIRKQYEARLNQRDTPRNRVAMAYLKNVTEKHLGFDRLYADEADAEVVDVPLQPGKHITMSVVIPTQVEIVNDSRVQLAAQTREAGELKIELLDREGKAVLGELYTAKTNAGTEYHAPYFDGTNPQTGEKNEGEYRIRWSLAGESRWQPVYVIQGEKREADGPAVLAAGQTITEDFEGKLDERWKLDRAAVSTEQKHGGGKSLKIDGQAELVFGKFDNLPVKITMWVWDAGEKRGNRGGNGPAWGVRTAVGDKFALRQVWRGYLSGDREYSWLNTGENQWFTPHPSGVTRKNGWSEWVFDFTDPRNPKITGHGDAVGRLDAKYTPNGAVAVFLMGSNTAGPLYVDDVKVAYPNDK